MYKLGPPAGSGRFFTGQNLTSVLYTV